MDLLRRYIREAAVSVQEASSQNLALYYSKKPHAVYMLLFDPDEMYQMFDDIVEERYHDAFGEQGAPVPVMLDVLMDDIANQRYLWKDYVYGLIQIESISFAPCHGAWEVTGSEAQHGYGPLMYDIAMSVAPKKTIIPDRRTVSPSAREVWRYYLYNRSDIKSMELDDIQAPGTETEEDDCTVYEGEPDDILNYAFKIKNPVPITDLITTYREFRQKLVALNSKASKKNMIEPGDVDDIIEIMAFNW